METVETLTSEAVTGEGRHALLIFALALLSAGALGFALRATATSWMLARMERALRGGVEGAGRRRKGEYGSERGE